MLICWIYCWTVGVWKLSKEIMYCWLSYNLALQAANFYLKSIDAWSSKFWMNNITCSDSAFAVRSLKIWNLIGCGVKKIFSVSYLFSFLFDLIQLLFEPGKLICRIFFWDSCIVIGIPQYRVQSYMFQTSSDYTDVVSPWK